MTAEHDARLAAAAQSAREILADLHHDVDEQLAALTQLAGHVHALTDTRQRATVPFLTAETRARLDAQLVDERRERRGQPTRDVGLAFLNRDTPTSGTGAIAAPVTVSATSWEAEAWATLAHTVSRTETFLARLDELTDRTRGWCHWPRDGRITLAWNIDEDERPSVAVLADHLRYLAGQQLGPARLTDLLRDLRHLVDQAETVVDGADRMHVGACPHCSRDTLVAYFRDGDHADGSPRGGFIRCDKDPTTGRHEKCLCTDPWCECKRRSWTYRHTWWRSPREAPHPITAKSWHDLAGRITLHRRARPTTSTSEEPTE